MDPVDKNWIETGSRRFASYSNLAPGDYTLQVKASNNDGIWNEKGISVKIIIDPPFWMTSWFYALVLLIFAIAALTYHRWRIRNKLKRALEIERIREEEQTNIRSKTARDFHDEMGHRLTRISMLTQLIKRKNKTDDKEFRYLLDQISENANNLYLGARDFIWAIDPRNDSLYEMAVRLKDFGDEIFDSTASDFRVQGLDESLQQINLSMELRRQVPLIFKEGMTNILKHAAAKNVMLTFDKHENECEIILTDDGKGFNLQYSSKGYGLQNMHTRAEKINMQLKISSQLGRGTQLSCSVKFTQSGVLPGNPEDRIHIKINS
jgi:signal transduction histidine kinase